MGSEGSARPSAGPTDSACVVVIGDVARSPRMCLHALALAEAGYQVEMIGSVETPIPAVLAESRRIRVSAIASPAPAPASSAVRGHLVGVGRRLLGQQVGLARALAGSRQAAIVLVQNPPSLHILPVLFVLRWLRGTRVILDWHNFGWTLLGMRFGERGVLVALAGLCERALGRRADLHLCVSRAMAERLRCQYSIEATPFLDRPPHRRGDDAGRDISSLGRDREPALRTLGLADAQVRALLNEDAVLVVSATSWSADEDFSLLLDALRHWSDPGEAAALPPLVVVVSGRGPLRSEFERAVATASLRRVTVRTVWLGAEEYHDLLIAADLGVCLHRSSSGVDLPMKLADMLGAALPTCVLDYGACLREALGDADDGLYFRDAAGLVALWRRVLGGNRGQLAVLRDRLACHPGPSWQDDWSRLVEPLVRGLSRAHG